MKNSEYWKQRFEQLEAAQNKKGVDALAEIEKQYRQAQKQLEGQIARWYQRFADNNGISIAQARQYLKGSDLEEFKWDVWDYIKHGEENAVDGQWKKQLENASAKYHISKLEALKIQTQQSLETMFAKQLGTVSKTMGDVFQSGYYHTAYELQNGFKIGWDVAGLNQSQIEKVLSKPWAVDGKNFSERIWQNKQKLISEVHNELTQNIMLGADPQKAIDSLAKKMGTSKSNAGRLVMTEEAYFSSAAQKDCFEELGVERYEVVATLDSHTSEICRSLDGKHFPMKDFQAGVTAPPFHVYCRSTTVPYFEDDFGEIGERAARDENGKTYYIPSDMTYQQWKETFVDGGDKSGLTAVPHSDILESRSLLKNGVSDVHFVGRIDKEIYRCVTEDIVTDEVIITDERIEHIRERHPGDYERYVRYMEEIIAHPDYILEANKPNTAFILKQIQEAGEQFELILRLKVCGDPAEYKNSIITFLKVKEKKWNKYLRNKKILYKNE